MRHLIRIGLVALAITSLPLGARADVLVQTPWVTVHVRKPPVVGVPVLPADPAPIIPGDPPPVPVQVPRPVVPAPGSVAPPVVSIPAVGVPTVSDFVAAFRPCPGVHEVVVQHPFTCQPVRLRFTLPAGAPRKVRVNRRVLEFDYGLTCVCIRFLRDGGVQVRY